MHKGNVGVMGRMGWWKIGLQTMAARGEFTMQNLHRKIKKARKKKKKKMGKVPSPLASSNFNKLQMI